MKGGIALSKKTNSTKPAFYYSMLHDKDVDFLHVSLYTLTANKIRTLHFHRVVEIGKCIKGSGICYLNDKEIPFSEGDIQIICPYEPHYNTYNTPGTLLYQFANFLLETSSAISYHDQTLFSELQFFHFYELPFHAFLYRQLDCNKQHHKYLES